MNFLVILYLFVGFQQWGASINRTISGIGDPKQKSQVEQIQTQVDQSQLEQKSQLDEKSKVKQKHQVDTKRENKDFQKWYKIKSGAGNVFHKITNC